MIPEEKISEFKKQLLDERSAIEREIKELEKVPDFGSDVTDVNEEEADEAEEFSTNVGIAATLNERLSNINSALEKISNRTYGQCEKCGKEINSALLTINPESRLCAECKLSLRHHA